MIKRLQVPKTVNTIPSIDFASSLLPPVHLSYYAQDYKMIERGHDIARQGWHIGRYLRSDGSLTSPYNNRNAAGMTNEALYCCCANGKAGPDTPEGAELKVISMCGICGGKITTTLTTAAPDGGLRFDDPLDYFKRFGTHSSKTPNRLNVTGMVIAGTHSKKGRILQIDIADENKDEHGLWIPNDIDRIVAFYEPGKIEMATWNLQKMLNGLKHKLDYSFFTPYQTKLDPENNKLFAYNRGMIIVHGFREQAYIDALYNGNIKFDPADKRFLAASGEFKNHGSTNWRTRTTKGTPCKTFLELVDSLFDVVTIIEF